MAASFNIDVCDPDVYLEVYNFVSFLCEELLPISDCSITVEFADAEECGCRAGWCSGDDDGEYVVIVNDSLEPIDILHTLAHEFTHIEQVERGDLDPVRMLWKGMLWQRIEHYEDAPWEREAYANEDVLFELYCKQLIRVTV